MCLIFRFECVSGSSHFCHRHWSVVQYYCSQAPSATASTAFAPMNSASAITASAGPGQMAPATTAAIGSVTTTDLQSSESITPAGTGIIGPEDEKSDTDSLSEIDSDEETELEAMMEHHQAGHAVAAEATVSADHADDHAGSSNGHNASSQDHEASHDNSQSHGNHAAHGHAHTHIHTHTYTHTHGSTHAHTHAHVPMHAHAQDPTHLAGYVLTHAYAPQTEPCAFPTVSWQRHPASCAICTRYATDLPACRAAEALIALSRC